MDEPHDSWLRRTAREVRRAWPVLLLVGVLLAHLGGAAGRAAVRAAHPDEDQLLALVDQVSAEADMPVNAELDVQYRGLGVVALPFVPFAGPSAARAKGRHELAEFIPRDDAAQQEQDLIDALERRGYQPTNVSSYQVRYVGPDGVSVSVHRNCCTISLSAATTWQRLTWAPAAGAAGLPLFALAAWTRRPRHRDGGRGRIDAARRWWQWSTGRSWPARLLRLGVAAGVAYVPALFGAFMVVVATTGLVGGCPSPLGCTTDEPSLGRVLFGVAFAVPTALLVSSIFAVAWRPHLATRVVVGPRRGHALRALLLWRATDHDGG